MGCDQETVRAAEKIILPGDRDRLGCVTQIRVRATCQRDEFSLCTSKFESDHPSHAAHRHFRAWKNARSVARVQVQAEITPPTGFTGSMPINVTGWDSTGPIGG